jgi:protein-L-isoaspartate(D-aspartate) O-methyltransferase
VLRWLTTASDDADIVDGYHRVRISDRCPLQLADGLATEALQQRRSERLPGTRGAESAVEFASAGLNRSSWSDFPGKGERYSLQDAIEKYQQQLLHQSRYIYVDTPLSEAVELAYLATPRHLFVKRYREWATKEWREVNADNLQEHLATLYRNGPLILFGEDDQNIPSTISQPSFVLRMLDMLQIEPGQNVFELGTGSGWNAALIGKLVGPQGRVHTLEIIPELAQSAAAIIAEQAITNVKVIEGDGGEGYVSAAPYDRATFTAGAYDLPHHFFEQLKDGGLLLVVIKTAGGGDNLFVLRKSDDHFKSIDSTPCGFVQVRGKYEVQDLKPQVLDEVVTNWTELNQQEVARRPFWWGSKGKRAFPFATSGIRSFLGITEPLFRSFKSGKDVADLRDDYFFGLWDSELRSLAIARDDLIVGYGNASAFERLLQRIREWMELGMPTASNFDLQIYPINATIEAGNDRWIVRRRESQFIWSLQRISL